MALNNKNRIAILMSTYNGEKYLSEQLSSILNQSCQDYTLYIRDDGSTDKTIDIITEYIKKDNRFVLLKDSIQHRGPKESFLWLLREIKSEFYMFCDQDDVWESPKVKISFEKSIGINSEIPILICTDLKLVNHNLELLHESMWKTHKIYSLVDNKNGLKIASMFPGCTMLFNRKTRELAINEKFDFPLHDMLISFVSLRNNGLIIPIKQSLIKYRQHTNNVVGMYAGKHWMIHKFFNIYNVISNNIRYYSMVNSYLGVSAFEYLVLKTKHFFKLI